MSDESRKMTDHTVNQSNQVHHDPEQVNTVCYFTFNSQDALSHLRLIGPARYLGINVIQGVENGHVFVERAQLGDVIVLQRDFPRAIDDYQAILSLSQQNNIPIILDFDDLLFELPEDHPDRLNHIFTWTFVPMYQALLQANLVTVTTSLLRKYMQDFNTNVLILPNYLDDQLWQLIPPAREPKQDKKIRIGYMGGLSHQPDLAFLSPVFHNLIRRYPDKLEFQFWGTQPPREIASYPFVTCNDQIIWNYQDFATFFQTQSADIFLSPLVDNLFNSCKSSIKYLEYGSLGVPGVFSKITPYTSVIRHGENGFLASTIDEWIECLGKLIENPELRYTIATNAQADIRSNWLMSQNAHLWLSAFQKAKEVSPSSVTKDTAQIMLINNIARQTTMWHSQTVAWRRDAENQLQQLNTTLFNITNSKTYQIALMLRRIREVIFPPKSQREKILDRLLKFTTTKSAKRVE